MKERSRFEQHSLREFGARLKVARIGCHLTQAQLAELIGVPQSKVAIYEAGNSGLKSETIEKIADKLMVDPYWLKYGDQAVYDVVRDNGEIHYSIEHVRTEEVTREEMLDEIADKADRLDDEHLKILFETANAMWLDQDDEAFSEYVGKRSDTMIAAVIAAKKEKERSSREIIDARVMSGIHETFPKKYRKIKKGEATEMEKVEAASMSFFKTYRPELYDEYMKNPTEDNLRRILSELLGEDFTKKKPEGE